MMNRSDEYFAATQRLLRNLQAPCFETFWAHPPREGEWHGRSLILQELSFLNALAFQRTGRRSYLDRARSFLRLYASNERDGSEHFASPFLGQAYEMIGPLLPPEDRRAVAARWISAVRWFLDHFVGPEGGDYTKWNNVSNHAIASCFYADYVRALCPKESRPHGFERITDRVWQICWKRREFQEQASNYEGFTEVFLCLWAELRGVGKEFFRTPSIQNMFARNARIVSPAGIVTAYADSGHYEHASSWIALFEKAATDTGEAGFRQVAWDIFRCLEQVGLGRQGQVLAHFIHRNRYAGRIAYALTLWIVAYVGLAVLWSEKKRLTAPRPACAGVNARLPLGYVLKPRDLKQLPQEKLVACHVALTGGDTDPTRQTYLLLSIGPQLVHDHADAGAILMMSRGRTCLLGTNGYLAREFLYHNVFYVQEAGKKLYPLDAPGRMGDPSCSGVLEAFETGGRSSYCRVMFDSYHGWPLALRREIVVDPFGAVTIVDRATARAKGLCGGLLFHATAVRKQTEGVYRLRTGLLRSFNGMEWRNGPGALDVELRYPEVDVLVRSLRDSASYNFPHYKTFPCVHYQKTWRRSYTARKCLCTRAPLAIGKTNMFITHLRPVGE